MPVREIITIICVCVPVSKFVCLWVYVCEQQFFQLCVCLWLTSNWRIPDVFFNLSASKTSVCVWLNSDWPIEYACMYACNYFGKINKYQVTSKLYCQQTKKKHYILPIHSSSHSSFKKVSTWIIVSLKKVSTKKEFDL